MVKKKVSMNKKKESLLFKVKRSTTLADGEMKSRRNLNILKMINNSNKEQFKIIKPKTYFEDNKKIIEINKKKIFGFFRNSKKPVYPSNFVTN